MHTETLFEGLALAEPLQRALREKNYTQPTPIQEQAIPLLLEGRDLLGSAQTGTGKTAAFALPILHRLHITRRRAPQHGMRALVLTPTRELAAQVAQSFEVYGRYTKARHALVYGGVKQGPQVHALRKGVDVLIATPGRLLDLYQQGHVDFSYVESFVLDEADRMLDMGFIHDIRKIVAELPQSRQSLFFSATFSSAITRLAGEILNDPAEVRIAPQTHTAERVNHRLCFVDRDDKPSLLDSLLAVEGEKPGRNLTLVFSRTKHGADRIAKRLAREGARAVAIHGNKSQGARSRALESFRSGKCPVLVATDVAARGIDVKDVTLVVNYDMPVEPEAYVHRIGRTARGGAEGQALSFCTGEDLKELRAIERLIKQEVEVYADHDFHRSELEARRSQGGGSGKSFKGKGKAPQKRKPREYAAAGKPREFAAGGKRRRNFGRPQKARAR